MADMKILPLEKNRVVWVGITDKPHNTMDYIEYATL